MKGALRRAFRALIPLLLSVVCVLAQPGCTCTPDPPPPVQGVIACRPRHPTRATVAKASAASETVAAGSAPGSFSVTSTGEASFIMPLVTPPGRAGVEPHLALTYSSAGGDGVLGRGFSLTGLSMVTRCPRNLAEDGEIREVRYDAGDALCLDGKRLVRVGEEPGRVEYRTLPDSMVKVVGQWARAVW